MKAIHAIIIEAMQMGVISSVDGLGGGVGVIGVVGLGGTFAFTAFSSSFFSSATLSFVVESGVVLVCCCGCVT